MNQDNKKQIIIAGVLGVALVAVLGYQFFIAGGPTSTESAPEDGVRPARTRGGAAASPTPPTLQPLDINFDELIESVEVEPIDYMQQRVARNPQAPLVGASGLIRRTSGDEDEGEVVSQVEIEATATRQVHAIVFSETNPLAVVDDVVTYVGYVFPNGTEVYAIEKWRVLFKVGDAIVPVEMKL